ncbi:MAG: hypothetical protein ABEJ05_02480 [Haloglomus sp.]
MSQRDRPDPTTDGCTTTDSFDDHGIHDGADLLTATYYRLAAADTEFEPTASFFDRLESAFVWAYLGAVDGTDVPDHVMAAVEDAREQTRAEFAERPEADLRTDVIPAFYRRIAGFHCAYRD